MKTQLALLVALSFGMASCSSTKKATATTSAEIMSQTLDGSWELDLIPYPDASFDVLYPQRKPNLRFNEAEASYSGYSGCNTIHGKLEKAADGVISFKGDMMMTRMACMGDGEKVFLENLKKVNHYAVSKDGKTLTFIQGDIALMRFHRINPENK